MTKRRRRLAIAVAAAFGAGSVAGDQLVLPKSLDRDRIG
jgi:hypothetical protein